MIESYLLYCADLGGGYRPRHWLQSHVGGMDMDTFFTRCRYFD